MRSRRGLTLVEALVVLGILAVLAGIVFASLGPAREAARTAHCSSNIRQILMALRMYRNDYDGVEAVVGVPMTASQLGLPADSPGDHRAEVRFYDRYLGGMKFHCPHNPPYWFGYLSLSTTEDPAEGGPFSRRAAEEGEGLIYYWDEWHNPFRLEDLRNIPQWETKKVILGRLNGQMLVRRFPIHSHRDDWAKALREDETKKGGDR